MVRVSIYFIFWVLFFSEIVLEWNVIQISSVSIYIIVNLDFIRLFFLSLVSLISCSVIYYSTSYISSEKFFGRFIILVVIFILRMYLLIVSPNMVRVLLGWDGLGVTSYLLVVYYQSNKSYHAGIITGITNRIGDVAIYIIVGIMIYLGDWTYIYITNTNITYSSIIVAIIIFACCTKRAQMPFSSWLPAAMAAPTPVSALVHSSTLVTAGVYLLIRFNNLLLRNDVMLFLIVLGLFTIFMSGISAMFEYDIKKIVALSTLSQLGLIIIVLGLHMPIISYFHLLCHAYFKAILFIGAGIIIHSMKDYQDMRSMRMISLNILVTNAVVVVSNLSLCGLPFMAGFYSKDLILEYTIINNNNMFLFLVLFFCVRLTVLYSCRLIFMLNINISKNENMFNLTENDKYISTGIFILFPFSICSGSLLRWVLLDKVYFIFIPLWIKLSTLFIILVSAIIIFFLLKDSFKLSNLKQLLIFHNMWFMPNTFRIRFNKLGIKTRKKIYIVSEIVWIEYALFMFFKRVSNLYNYFILNINHIFMLNFLVIFVLLILNI